jgi:hypothetical protein
MLVNYHKIPYLEEQKMKSFYKISITCLILILCALVATHVVAEGASVLNPGSAGEANVMSSSSGDLGNVMNSLPIVDGAGNVINPSSDNVGNVMNSLSDEEMNILSETQTALWQGQTSQVYRVTLSCPGTVRMTSSYGAKFNLYAKKSGGSYCPTAYSLRNNYDKVAYGTGGTTYMSLEPGVWCLMVYGSSGSGSYSLRITSSCSNPTPYPTQTPAPCGVYKTDSRQGFLNQGQAAVYGYSIPSDSRSKIEWSMTSSGSSNGGDTPIIAASTGDTSIESTSSSGSSTFDLYILKNCNPKNSQCRTQYYSRGPNSYVSIANPSTGSIYYAMVYARSGSGTFNLKMNSYKCTGGGVIPMMTSSTGVTAMAAAESGGAEDTGVGSEVSPPTADIILSEGAE